MCVKRRKTNQVIFSMRKKKNNNNQFDFFSPFAIRGNCIEIDGSCYVGCVDPFFIPFLVDSGNRFGDGARVNLLRDGAMIGDQVTRITNRVSTSHIIILHNLLCIALGEVAVDANIVVVLVSFRHSSRVAAIFNQKNWFARF
jgi:hypothetical protein